MKTPAVLTGLALGDALGVPWETRPWDHDELLAWDGESFVDSPHHGTTGGQWSDDTILAKALTEALLAKGHYDTDHVGQAYVDAWRADPNRGFGGTTVHALKNIEQGVRAYKAAKPDVKYPGAGAPMRIAPLGLFYRHNEEGRVYRAEDDAKITHNDPESIVTSVAVTQIVASLCHTWNFEGDPPWKQPWYAFGVASDTVWILKAGATQFAKFVTQGMLSVGVGVSPEAYTRHLTQLARYDASYGWAPVLVATAIYCWDYYRSWEAVPAAIRLGGDTDTRAAIVGAFAGAALGLEGLPRTLLRQLDRREELQELDQKLFDVHERKAA
jgi:ADP-ribosylglycohydrolase